MPRFTSKRTFARWNRPANAQFWPASCKAHSLLLIAHADLFRRAPHVSLVGAERDFVLQLRGCGDKSALVAAAGRASEMLAVARAAVKVEAGSPPPVASAAVEVVAELEMRAARDGPDHLWFGGAGRAAGLPAEIDMELLARWVASARLAVGHV